MVYNIIPPTFQVQSENVKKYNAWKLDEANPNRFELFRSTITKQCSPKLDHNIKNENKFNECGLLRIFHLKAFKISGFLLHANYSTARIRTSQQCWIGKVFRFGTVLVWFFYTTVWLLRFCMMLTLRWKG